MGQINQQQNNADGRSNRLRTLNEYRDAINELMSENMQTHHRYAAHAIGAESPDCTGCARYQILVQIENIIRGFINDEIMHNQHLTLTSMTAVHYYSVVDERGTQQIYRAPSIDRTRKLFALYNGTYRMMGMPARIDRCKVEIMIKYLIDDTHESDRLVRSLANDHIFAGLVIENDDHQLMRVFEDLAAQL